MNTTLLFLLCIFAVVNLVNCIEFDRTRMGVAFSPFVNASDTKKYKYFYSLRNIQTMLEVISTKFTMVVTYGGNVMYSQNLSETHVGSSVSLIPEAAALINRRRNRTDITVIIGIYLFKDQENLDAEVRVAFESARIANSIHQGTAVGIKVVEVDIGNKGELEITEKALNVTMEIKQTAKQLGLQVGVRQNCSEREGEMGDLLQKIANVSDFIICGFDLTTEEMKSGATEGFLTAEKDLLESQYFIKRANSDVDVMGETSWPSHGADSEPWFNIDNMKKYWELFNGWSSQNNFTMWMLEAMDTPHRNSSLGWWKLRNNSEIDLTEGYIEKIYETTTTSVRDRYQGNYWIWGYVVGALVAILLLSFIVKFFMLWRNVRTLKETLTKPELQEFLQGIGEESSAAQEFQSIQKAFTFPYDTSFEIPKNKLKIKYNKVLGNGEFGCVYQAVIIGETGNTEVALKMPNLNCTANALKSLLAEIKILIYLGQHPNIVSIIGAYTQELNKGVLYVATELCSLGSLKDLFCNKEMCDTITTRMMLRLSYEISCGMEHLENNRVIHGDLAARNVLLTYDRTAKITDFGLSKKLYDNVIYVKSEQELMPWRWMAIESLRELKFSSKSDVWSYGITIWEVFSMGDLPYPDISWNVQFLDTLTSGFRMNCPTGGTSEIYQIMTSCWNLEPGERPSFTTLKALTGKLLDVEEEYARTC